MMRKGTVFKEKERSLILMTGEFEFVEISKGSVRGNSISLGKEVSFGDLDTIRPGKRRLPVLAAACLLLVMLFSVTLYRQYAYSAVYAYVGMDINPSLELAVDKNLEVISVEPGNTDARNLLQNISLRGLTLDSAMRTVFKACVEKDYINDKTGARVLITTTPGKDALSKAGEDEADLENKILASARAGLAGAGTPEAEVLVVRVNREERRLAKDSGMSPGRYFLWKRARESGTGLTPEQINNQSIGKTLQSNKKLRAAVAGNASKVWTKKAAKVKKKGLPGIPPGKVKNNPPGQAKKAGPKQGQGKGVTKSKPARGKNAKGPANIYSKSKRGGGPLTSVNPRTKNGNGPPASVNSRKKNGDESPASINSRKKNRNASPVSPGKQRPERKASNRDRQERDIPKESRLNGPKQ